MRNLSVACPIISAGTGSDVYFSRLKHALVGFDVDIDIIKLPYRYEFLSLFGKRLQSRLMRYDLIHTNADYASAFFVQGKPLVATFHHDVFDSINMENTSLAQKVYYYSFLKNRIKKGLSCADMVVCPSEYSLSSLMNRYGDSFSRCQTILNGLDVDIYRSSSESRRISRQLLFVGSFSRRKGFDSIIRIMELLGPKGYSLICVGGEKPRSLSEIPYISFSGRISEHDLIQLYQSSACFVFPSRLEGFGYSVVEAALSGCPVVTSNHSALPEVLNNFDRCCFVDGFDPVVWAKAIEDLSGELSWSLPSIITTEKFSLSSMASQYVSLYSRLRI